MTNKSIDTSWSVINMHSYNNKAHVQTIYVCIHRFVRIYYMSIFPRYANNKPMCILEFTNALRTDQFSNGNSHLAQSTSLNQRVRTRTSYCHRASTLRA